MQVRVTLTVVLYLAAGVVLIGAYLVFPAPLSRAVLFESIAASAVVGILVGVRRFEPAERTAWHVIAGGVAAFLLGEITWDVYMVGFDQDPFPSVADVFYVVGYPLLAAGLCLLVRSRSGGLLQIAPSLLDAAILTVAAGVVSWVFLIEPYAGDHTLTFGEKALSVAYPLGDVLLLAVLAGLVLASGARTPAFGFLAVAFGANVVADIAFGILALSGSDAAATWIDVGWLLGYLSFGACGLHPSMATLAQFTPQTATRLTLARTAALAAAAVAAPTVLAYEEVRGHEPTLGLFIVGAALLPLLVLARLVALFRNVERLGSERQILLLSERAARAEAETAQRLLAEQNERLRDVDRLKDEFVALVSHELRTPLTSVTGYIEILLEEGVELTDEHRGFLEIIDRNGRRLLRLVGDLLFVAQVEAGKLVLDLDDLELGLLAAECVEGLRPRAEEKGVQLVVLNGTTATVRGDRARLAQLLDNLVSNAVKFTPAGGIVKVSVAEAHGRVAVFVTDTGMGIPFVEQRRLFERFFRTSNAQAAAIEGTGLGLTISKAIAEAHGGDIEVESVEGEGATFRLLLPLSRAELEGLAETAEASPVP
ncbi:MAG: HAMP domain-containing sensor histidine kinase [Gaiellaceae bacterium]